MLAHPYPQRGSVTFQLCRLQIKVVISSKTVTDPYPQGLGAVASRLRAQHCRSAGPKTSPRSDSWRYHCQKKSEIIVILMISLMDYEV